MDPNTNLDEFFDGAKTTLAQANELSSEVSDIRAQRDKLEGQLSALKKKRDDEIAATYKKRRNEIEKTYDLELSRANEQLRKAQARRDKAKNQGVRERIADETADLKADIKAINARTRADFKAEHVPGYCDSSFFLAIYYPNSVKDVIIIILTFAVVFFVIPFGLYKLFFNGSTAALIIIYVLDVIIFGGLYVLISRKTVMEHGEVLRQAKLNRQSIALEKKKIASITRKIENDTNESYYDLARFDDDIAHIKQQLADITMQKNDALSTFENVTKNIIIDDITATAKPQIDAAERQLSDVTKLFNEKESARKQIAMDLSTNYEAFLGREFMSRAKIEKLQEIVYHGTATTISEAIEEYNRLYDI